MISDFFTHFNETKKEKSPHIEEILRDILPKISGALSRHRPHTVLLVKDIASGNLCRLTERSGLQYRAGSVIESKNRAASNIDERKRSTALSDRAIVGSVVGSDDHKSSADTTLEERRLGMSILIVAPILIDKGLSLEHPVIESSLETRGKFGSLLLRHSKSPFLFSTFQILILFFDYSSVVISV